MELSTAQEDGSTLEAHLRNLWRQNSYRPEDMPEQLQEVECEECVKYLWGYFLSMNLRRTSSGFALNPIPHEGVEAWARGRRYSLQAFEYIMLDRLEALYLSIVNKQKKA